VVTAQTEPSLEILKQRTIKNLQDEEPRLLGCEAALLGKEFQTFCKDRAISTKGIPYSTISKFIIRGLIKP